MNMEFKNLVEEMIHGFKFVEIRHLILEALLTGMNAIIKRFLTSLHSDDATVMQLTDIAGVFWILELIQRILITTQKKEPWIEVCITYIQLLLRCLSIVLTFQICIM